MSDSADFVNELVLGAPRGRRASALMGPMRVEVVRELTPEDLTVLAPPGPGTTPLVRIRATHHQLAQHLAKGLSNEEASQITGYSPSRVSILRGDPAFRELLSHYEAIADEQFVNVTQRMAALGLHSLEELHHRLEENPDDWTKRELMDLADLMLIKGRPGAGGSAPAGPAVAVQVQFIRAPGQTIEGEATSSDEATRGPNVSFG